MWTRRVCVSLVAVGCLASAWLPCANAADGEPNAAKLVRAVRQTELWLHDCNSLYLRVAGRWTKTPEGIAKRRTEIKEEYGVDDPNVRQFSGLRATFEQSLEFAVDRERVRYLTDDPGYWRQLKVYDGNELRIHEKYYHQAQEHYSLYNEIPERMFQELLACYYGWPRSQPHSFWYDKRDVNEAMDYYGRAEQFKLLGREVYRDVPCYVLDYQFPPERAADLTYRWFVGRSGGLLYGIQSVRGGQPGIEHWWSDYRQVYPGGWFPMKSSWCFYDSTDGGQAQLNSTCDLEVAEFHLNEPLAGELFTVSIQPGVKIQDNRSGQLRIYRLSPSLLGKAVEDFSEFSLPSPPPAKGKPLLIAFVDLEQRPSRHILPRLAALRDRVETIIIQAAPMTPDALAAWREKLNVSCEIGTITGDAEAVRRSWAATSLPWLILTDRKHVVRAEGFAADELEARIAEVSSVADSTPAADAVTGLVTDPQGQPAPDVRVTEFHADKMYITGTDGTFVSAYGPSEERRFFFAVDKQRQMVGVGRLAPGQRQVEIELGPARIVSGCVVDPEGRPVPGVQVVPLPMTSFYVLTDSQGCFDVGWQPEWAGDLDEFCLMARHLERNLATLKGIDNVMQTVEIKLAAALTLTGAVEEPNGVPISGADVHLSLRKGWSCGTPVKSVVTDAAGRYKFAALPQNQEYINFANAEGFWENGTTTGIINTAANHAEAGTIVLKRPNQSVSGVVVDSTGSPVANCSVGVRGSGQPQRQAETDAQGRFTLKEICSGPIEIWGKLDGVLYGTVEAEAGQEKVRLVVSPIP
ncbi:MAG: carboxypeptidase regulatory-like domain-containing protein [Sedimentisphaerales bacterium]|nr:carboxypeptidase regulatory-like domain-containing protein [Sedimentisphaerales bacterium]